MDASSSSLQLTFVATLEGHKDWVTAIAAPNDPTKKFIVTASRDKTAIVWSLTRDPQSYGFAKRALVGHNHIIQDVSLSQDGQYALTASWDRTMRLWDLSNGRSVCKFIGHTDDVLSASFSPDNRLIVSGSRDKTIKVWNTRGECKGDLVAQPSSSRGNAALSGHTEWVTAVRFSPDYDNAQVISAGCDKVVKVWNFKTDSPQLQVNHLGHDGFINTVAISPDGTLCASAGKDGIVMLWDLNKHRHLYSLEAGDVIHTLVFSPNRYWLCAATAKSIKIWDLLSKTIIDDLRPESEKAECMSLAWSADGSTLFSGYTDSKIRVWEVTSRASRQ